MPDDEKWRCVTCDLVARRDAGEAPPWDCILRTEYWDVAHSFNTSLRGWLVLVARRHVASVAEMTDEEAAALGRLIRRVSIALQEVTGCVKTYVIQFAEHPNHPHVHVHIVPRMADQPEAYRGVGVFNYLAATPEERMTEAEMNEVALRVREAMGQGEQGEQDAQIS